MQRAQKLQVIQDQAKIFADQIMLNNKSNQTGQMIEDVGKKLKLSSNVDTSKLVWRNYTANFEQDSIDIQDIMRGQKGSFDPLTQSYYPISQNLLLFKESNFSESLTEDKQPIFEENSIKDKISQQQPENRKNLQISENDQQVKQQSVFDSQVIASSERPKQQQVVLNERIEDDSKSKQLANESYQNSQKLYEQMAEDKQEDKKQQQGQIQQQQPVQAKAKHSKKKSESKSKNKVRLGNQILSPELLQSITRDFSTINFRNWNQTVKQVSQRCNTSKGNVVRMYQEWKASQKLKSQSSKKKEEPLGQLADRKRERAHQRINEITELLNCNPYLTQKQICDRLYEKDKSRKKIVRSAILRLLKSANYRKKTVKTQLSEDARVKLLQKRKEFMAKYSQLQKQKANFYYLDELVLHKYMNYDSYWKKPGDMDPPYHSKKFISDAILLITFLSPSGNLYWEIRGGDYQKDEYYELLSRMFKKMKKAKENTNIIIIKENPLREYEGISQLVQRGGNTSLKYPSNSDLMSPLQLFFTEIKQKCSKIKVSSQQEMIKEFSELVSSYKKPAFLSFISQAKLYTAKAQNQQFF